MLRRFVEASKVKNDEKNKSEDFDLIKKKDADSLVQKYKLLVYKYAFALSTKYSDVDDLIQQGFFGLLAAIENFDPEKSNNPMTYFSAYIIGHIRIFKNSSCFIHIPRNVYVKKLKEYREEKNFCGAMAVPMEFRETFYYEYERNCSIADIDRIFEDYDVIEFNRVLKDKLNPVEYEVITRAFGIGYKKEYSPTAISKETKISMRKVCRSLKTAIEKLRNCKELKEFFDIM